jgi:hypothetical protein
MNALIRMLVVGGICLCPVVVASFLIGRERRAKLARNKAPFGELRRRPAGEGIRIKLGEFDERILMCITALVGVPVLVAMTAWFTRSSSWVSLVPSIVLSVAWTAIAGFRLHRIIKERDNYRLGFDGERYVGEELSSLIADGFEIFHDVPFDGFNIDHVVVGPPGIFSIETKTRRKPVNDARGKEYRVEFDGSCLRWPWGTDTYGLDQAANNAQTLSKWLSSAVGDPVKATAILTLPGWMVDRKAPVKNVHVLNPKEIIKLCRGDERISENLIKRVCHQLGQKCRLEVE